MADNIDVLEKRLSVLEKRVFGASNKDAHYPKCTDTLSNVQTKLTKAVTGRKKINKVYDRLQELQNCLDPAKADEMTLSDAAKAEIILAEEDFLLQQSVRFETLKQLEDTLDSEHIKAVPSLTGKLQDLSQIQIKQQDQAAALSEYIHNILATCNTVPSLTGKLQDLSQIQIKQQDQAAALSEEIRNLLATYNSIVKLLSKQFAQWDEIVTKAEQGKQIKKPLD